MKLFLPESKIQKILLACSDLISKPRPSVRQVAHVTSLLTSAFPATNCLKLYCNSSIELRKFQTLSANQDFDQLKALRPQAVSDLNWITENLTKFNDSYFGSRPIDIIIECDASLVGWRAFYLGQAAHGRWSELEALNHIN